MRLPWPLPLTQLPGFEGVVNVDAHPLVREYFGEKFEQKYPVEYQQAHIALYTYFKALPEKYLPDTLEKMEPLFLAIIHGCKANLHSQVFEIEYTERVRRPNKAYAFFITKLGATGSELTILSSFFEACWHKPSSNLSEEQQALLLSLVGYRLRILGRFGEAFLPMKKSLEMAEGTPEKDWKAMAMRAANLAELLLIVGEIKKAITFCEKALEYANLSEDGFLMEAKRCELANALLYLNEEHEAMRLFFEAELMQRKRHIEREYLFSLRGFQFGDLLLSKGKFDEALIRAQVNLSLENKGASLLDKGLNRLLLGKTYFLMNKMNYNYERSQLALEWLNQSIDFLRNSAFQDFLALGLRIRSNYHCHNSNFTTAEEDIKEVFDISSPGRQIHIAEPYGMRLHLIDFYLESAHLNLSQDRLEEAKNHAAQAAQLIKETGYHRRDRELEELEKAISQ